MVPTMIIFGLVLGKAWKPAVAAGALIWPLLVILDGGQLNGAGQVLQAAVIGAANAAAGVAVHQGMRWTVRHRRARPHQLPARRHPD